jgi:hypothetical protein
MPAGHPLKGNVRITMTFKGAKIFFSSCNTILDTKQFMDSCDTQPSFNSDIWGKKALRYSLLGP